MATLTNGKRALALLEDDSNVLFPAFSAVSDDATVAIPGDGVNSRIAVISVGVGTCNITFTRAVDGATFVLPVTVEDPAPPDELPGFTVHLGAEY